MLTTIGSDIRRLLFNRKICSRTLKHNFQRPKGILSKMHKSFLDSDLLVINEFRHIFLNGEKHFLVAMYEIDVTLLHTASRHTSVDIVKSMNWPK